MVITTSYTKEGIAEVIALIGGFIGLMKNVSYIVLGAYQTFTIDKSMIKKVFSKRTHDYQNPTPIGRTVSLYTVELDQQ